MRFHRLKKCLVIIVLLNALTVLLVLRSGRIHGLAFIRYLYSAYSSNDSNEDEDRVMCENPVPNSTNAIAVLTSHDDFMELASRLTQLDARLLDNCSSAILLFHTGFPFASEFAQIMNATRRRVIFRNVDKYFASFPDGFNPYINEPTFVKRGKWNYHQMIRFWFKLIFEIEEIQRFEYVMRLDTDSRLIGRWFNVFELMRTRQLVYLANEQHFELEKVLPGTMNLQKFFVAYQKQIKLVPQDQAKVDSAFTKDGIRTYYNNFEVFQTKFFRRTSVRAWIDAIDASHGIYKYRWGDAMLRYLTLALFAKDYQIGHRTQLNLSYCHPC
jgi:hypothetical protein